MSLHFSMMAAPPSGSFMYLQEDKANSLVFTPLLRSCWLDYIYHPVQLLACLSSSSLNVSYLGLSSPSLWVVLEDQTQGFIGARQVFPYPVAPSLEEHFWCCVKLGNVPSHRILRLSMVSVYKQRLHFENH